MNSYERQETKSSLTYSEKAGLNIYINRLKSVNDPSETQTIVLKELEERIKQIDAVIKRSNAHLP